MATPSVLLLKKLLIKVRVSQSSTHELPTEPPSPEFPLSVMFLSTLLP